MTTESTISGPGPGDPIVGIELAEVRADLARLGRTPTALDVADALRGRNLVVSDATVLATLAALRRDSRGAGRLDPLLADPEVTDVLVNGPERVYVDRGHGLEPTAVRFSGEPELRALATRIVADSGRRLDAAMPYADAWLADGVRVHAVLDPVAWPGTCLSLRVPSRVRLSLDDWVARGSVTPSGARVLRQLVAARVAFLVSGGTGTGKTTLLASLLGLVPQLERIVVVEDSRELDPDHPHVVRLQGRPPNAEAQGAITMTELVRQALRMRPDRLVVGEVRGAELCDLLTALNTGHEGGCGTVHANSAAHVPARLEALAALGGMPRQAAHAQVAAALELIVHVRREPDGLRRVGELHVLARDDRTGLLRTEPALLLHRDGRVERGPGSDRLDALLAERRP